MIILLILITRINTFIETTTHAEYNERSYFLTTPYLLLKMTNMILFNKYVIIKKR